MRILALWLTIAACVSWPWQSSWASSWPERYDAQIEKAAKRWLPGLPWAMWKAQLIAESGLDPAAVSPAGARGLAQFMPGTWIEVSRALGWGIVSPHLAEYAVEGGAYYLAKLRKAWRAPRPQDDRVKLAQAAYNAGLGTLLAAQGLCGGPNLYAEIVACLPRITGRHAAETLAYVPRIWRLWARLEAGA